MSSEHPPKDKSEEIKETGETAALDPEEFESYQATVQVTHAERTRTHEPDLAIKKTREELEKMEDELGPMYLKDQKEKKKEDKKQEKALESKKSWKDRKGFRGPVGRLGSLVGKITAGIFGFFASVAVWAKSLGGNVDVDQVSESGSAGGGHKKASSGHGGGGGHGSHH